MKKRLLSIFIVTALLLVSCGKKDVAEDTVIKDNSASIEDADQESTEQKTEEKNSPIEKVDISADVTPGNIIVADESEDLLGELKVNTERPKQNFLKNNSYNFIHYTFKAYKDSTEPIVLYVNGETSLLDNMPIIEAGKTYEFEIYRETRNYGSVSAYIEADGTKSNTATIYAYDRIDSENAKVVYSEIHDFEALTKDLISDGYISDDNKQEALSRVEKAANEIKENGDILEVVRSDDHIYIRFNSGIEYIYAPPTQGEKASDDGISIYTYQPFADPNGANSLPTEEMDSLAEHIDDTFERIEYSHDVNDGDIDMDYIIDHFSRNQVIIWDGHGDYDERIGAYLLTGDIWEGKQDYQIGKGWLLTNGGRYCVGADFFDQWFDEGSLENSFIVLSACCSGIEDSSHSLLKILRRKGASVVVGFNNYVKISYANNLVDFALRKMCTSDGDTFELYSSYDAFNLAIGAYGKDDSDKTPAAPIYCGEHDYRFSTAIENVNNATIPDGVYSTALGVYGKNETDTFELYGHTTGNLKNARIDNTTGTLIIEAGFIYDEDSSKVIPYGKYELPLSSNYILEAGTGEGPMKYFVNDFNELFFDNSMNNGYEGFGFSIFVEDGNVNRILCWGS